MSRYTYALGCLVFLFVSCSESMPISDYEDCTIYRDIWGVPHIHGKTDADVAYGLAWASCEDDFQTIQEQLLALKGLYGEVKGKDGIVADLAIKYMGIVSYAAAHIDDLDAETLALIDGYLGGITAFANTHKSEWLHQDFLPLSRHHVVAGYLLGLVEISGASRDLTKLADGTIVKDLHTTTEKGSNAIAVSAQKTDEGETFLAINSHQPMEGWYSWYEAHLISDEGMNILGGTFPGAATIFHGTNEYLGWAHTVNHADFSDVYRLTMHPTKKTFYKIGEEYRELEKISLKSYVKVFGPLQIPISRDIYRSDFGITFKVEEDFYAWRYQAKEAVKAIAQWYQMSKAKNFDEWKGALTNLDIPCTNIVYADGQDNIYYVSNARQPKRSSRYSWKDILPGEGEALWDEERWPLDSLPQVFNPSSGYVFNTNNTPFSSSGNEDDPRYIERYVEMGFKKPLTENNRSLRFQALMDTVTSLSYDEFLEIKYDQTYPNPLAKHPYNEEPLLHQDAKANPKLSSSIEALNTWNRQATSDNETTALFLLAKENLRQVYAHNKKIEDNDYIDAISMAQKEMLENLGTIKIALGEFQRHRRAAVDLPMPGGGDVLAAIYSVKDDDGKYRAYSGESYIQLVRFDSISLPKIESIHAYGASARVDSKHYTDQMEMFARQERKSMTLDLQVVKDQAITQYHPKAIKEL